MSAEVIQTNVPTWNEVSAAHERTTQMAVQTVEAFAQVGDMLLKLKDVTPHGEFMQRCVEALAEKRNSDSHLRAATRRAQLYIRLATERCVWLPHKPQSLRQALALLPKPPAKTSGFIKERKRLDDADEARVQRAIQAEEARVRRRGRDAVKAAMQKRNAEMSAHYTKIHKEAEAKKAEYETLVNSVRGDGPFSEQEYDLIVGLLHPDQHPPEQQERATKAFHLMRERKARLVATPNDLDAYEAVLSVQAAEH
jgi:hypothetical protein